MPLLFSTSAQFLRDQQLVARRCDILLKISLAAISALLIYFIFGFGLDMLAYDSSKEAAREETYHGEGYSMVESSHGRKLLQIGIEFNRVNCTPRTINNYPGDFLTVEQRRHGLLAIHIIIALYMFVAVGISIEHYFVSVLNNICDKWKLQEDVAGTASI